MSTNIKRLVLLCITLLVATAGAFYWLSVRPSNPIPITGNRTDTTQAIAFLNQGKAYFDKANRTKTDLDSSFVATTSAYRISRKANFARGTGLSLDMYSKIYSSKGDTLRGRLYADSAIAVLKSNNLFYELGYAYFNRSGYYPLQGGNLLKRRIEWVELASAALMRSGSKWDQTNILKELADLQQLDLNYDEALKNLNLSLLLYDTANRDINNRARLIGIYDLLGVVYSTTGRHRLALKYGLLALKITEELNDTTSASVATLYNRVGNSYDRMENFQLAYQYYNKGEQVALNNNDTARWFVLTTNKAKMLYRMARYHEAVQCLVRIPGRTLSSIDDLTRSATVHSFLMLCNLKLKDYKACRAYAKLMETDRQYGIKVHFSTTALTSALAEYYLAIHDLKNAEIFWKLGDRVYTKRKLLPYRISSYKQRIRLDSAEGDVTRYIQDLKQLQIMQDSSHSDRNAREIAQLQIEYETEKKNKDILLKEERIKVLDAENRIQQADLNHAMLARNVTIGGIILLVIIVGLLYNRYRFKNKINQTITERNNSLSQLLTEKEWLLKEIHHRVKNNLQIIISLLDSQSMYLRDNAALNAIRDSQSRVYCMSLIHKKLYQSDNIATINMKQYIDELVDYLSSAFGVQHSITFNLDIAAIQLSASQSIPIGLILNEAITNSIKYAFPEGSKGNAISIQLSAAGNQCQLTIRDNGIGLPHGFSEDSVTSLGISLMKGLSEDIEASFSMENREGTYVEITFRLEHPVPASATPEESMMLTTAI